MMTILLMPICALMNRARGSRFWGFIPSTEASRLLSMGIIACAFSAFAGSLILLPIVWGGLMIWCTFGWDKAWGGIIGLILAVI